MLIVIFQHTGLRSGIWKEGFSFVMISPPFDPMDMQPILATMELVVLLLTRKSYSF